MEDTELRRLERVEEVLDDGDGEEAAPRVDHEAAPRVGGRVVELDGGRLEDAPGREELHEGLHRVERPVHGPRTEGRGGPGGDEDVVRVVSSHGKRLVGAFNTHARSGELRRASSGGGVDDALRDARVAC